MRSDPVSLQARVVDCCVIVGSSHDQLTNGCAVSVHAVCRCASRPLSTDGTRLGGLLYCHPCSLHLACSVTDIGRAHSYALLLLTVTATLSLTD